MKRYLVILFFNITFLTNLINFCKEELPDSKQPTMPATENADMFQFDEKQLEALNEWAKVLEGRTEEELEELANIGEMVMQELVEQGIDPMEFLFHEDSPIWEKPPVLDANQTEEPVQENPVANSELESSKAPNTDPSETVFTVTDKEKLKNIKHKLEDIADKISSLRQKTEANVYYAEKLQSFDHALSDITYYVLTLKEDHLVKYLFQEKFEALYKLILDLHQALEIYEPQVYVTEFSLEGKDPYTILDVKTSDSFEKIYQQYQNIIREESPFTIENRLKEENVSEDIIGKKINDANKRWDNIIWAYETLQAKENSKYAFETLLNTIQNVLYKHDIITKFKEILKTYDPEALKMKEMQENREKKAREEQAKVAAQRPPWTQSVFAPPSSAAKDQYNYDDLDALWNNGAFDYTPEKGNDISGNVPQEKIDSSDKKPSHLTESTKDKKENKKTKEKEQKNKKEKEPKKKPSSKETDRKIFRVQNSFDTIQGIFSESEPLISELKIYLAKPYQPEDKEIALAVNQVLTEISQEFTSLEKIIKQDLEFLKNDKKDYIKNIEKAYKSFYDNEKVKKSLEMLNNFETQDDKIMYKNEGISADLRKRFVIAGITPPDETSLITPELIAFNNPQVPVAGNAINHLKIFKEAYKSFEKFINETVGQANKI